MGQSKLTKYSYSLLLSSIVLVLLQILVRAQNEHYGRLSSLHQTSYQPKAEVDVQPAKSYHQSQLVHPLDSNPYQRLANGISSESRDANNLLPHHEVSRTNRDAQIIRPPNQQLPALAGLQLQPVSQPAPLGPHPVLSGYDPASFSSGINLANGESRPIKQSHVDKTTSIVQPDEMHLKTNMPTATTGSGASMSSLPQPGHNEEMASRQTNIDENVFRPSLLADMPPDFFEGSSTSASAKANSLATDKPMIPLKSETVRNGDTNRRHTNLPEDDIKNMLKSLDSNNNVIQPTLFSLDSTRTLSSDPTELAVVQQQQPQQQPQMQPPNHYQVEYQSGKENSFNTTANPLLSSTFGSNDIGNYSSAATYEQSGGQSMLPAGVDSSSYFFSSSEKLPNHEKASNVWWAIGVGQEFERVSNLTQDDYLDYCAKSELLTSNKQRGLCRSNYHIMPIVARGLKMAIDECQAKFASSRWNCSLAIGKGGLHDEQPQGAQVFGDIMKQPNRERSFLNAIIAAGLAHAMTKACSQGEMPEECSCDKRIKLSNNRGNTEWVACSDDVEFGARFSRDFTESFGLEPETTSMINMHNYEVGRKVFKSATDITCTCQGGETGQCQTKRCWRQLGQFKDIGEELMRRYDGATHVQLSQKDPHKLKPVRRGVRKPKRKDLVFIDESPDYCSTDTRLGVLGTQNRACNSTSSGSDSCSLLCCGRGYQVVFEEIEEDCNCEFVWCCELKCKKCRRKISKDVCN